MIHFSKPFLFADDAKLLKIIKQLSDHSLLQQDFDQLHTWTIHNDLLFSINKCIQLSFNIKTSIFYSIDSTILPQLHSHHDLGLIVSDDLSWKYHYNYSHHLQSLQIQQTFSCPLQQYYTRNSTSIDYQNYGKNYHAIINLDHSISTIKTIIYTYLHDHFKNNFTSDKPCTYHFCCRCSNCYNVGTPSNISVM